VVNVIFHGTGCAVAHDDSVVIGSTNGHAKRTEPKRPFLPVMSVASVVMRSRSGETDKLPMCSRLGHREGNLTE
jgi:hypothetical protein